MLFDVEFVGDELIRVDNLSVVGLFFYFKTNVFASCVYVCASFFCLQYFYPFDLCLKVREQDNLK